MKEKRLGREGFESQGRRKKLAKKRRREVKKRNVSLNLMTLDEGEEENNS